MENGKLVPAMNFELDEESQTLLARFQGLRGRVAERALRHDREASFPVDNFQDLHQARLLGLSVPKAYGGSGAGLAGNLLLEVMAVEELSKACSSTGQGFHNHNANLEIIYVLGSKEQQERFSRDVVENGSVIANAISERGGKTVGDLKTKAKKVDGGYLINGQKFFSTNSGGAAWFHVWACVEGLTMDKGLIPCMIHRNERGVSVIDDWDPMGQRATTSGTTRYEDVFVPLQNVIGEPGEYYKLLLLGPYFQVGWAAAYVGIAGGALDSGLRYVKSTSRPWAETSYERAIDDPYVQNHVADMSVALEASRLLLYRSARMLEAAYAEPSLRPEAAVAIYQAKVLGTEAALDISSRIFQVCGARAAADAQKNGLDMYWRNARAFTLHDPVDYRKQRIGRHLLGVEPPPISWW